MNEIKIKQVNNNYEKYLSIKDINGRFNKAYKYEFYYECLWLNYALIEDRTKAFFYHIGFLKRNRDGVHSNSKIKVTIRKLLKIDKEKNRYNFDKLFYKLDYISKLIAWVKSDEETSSEYEKELKKVLNKYIVNDEFINTINYLNTDWRNIRNELVHGLCNKEIGAVSLELKALVENGYNSFKIITKAVSGIKRNNIRKKFRIQ